MALCITFYYPIKVPIIYFVSGILLKNKIFLENRICRENTSREIKFFEEFSWVFFEIFEKFERNHFENPFNWLQVVLYSYLSAIFRAVKQDQDDIIQR